MVAVISDKASGRTSTVATSDISISRPSIIKLELSPTDISRTVRAGNDLVIDLKNGEQIRIDGFFTGEGEKRSELVLEDESGNVWNGDYTDALADFQFEPAGAVDQLVGGAAGGGGSVLGILGPLGLLGAVAAAAGGGGGGGDNGGGEEPGPGPKAPGVILGDGDAFLNAEETAGGNVVVTISLNNTGAVAGDKLTVNGTTITLTAAQIAAGEVEITLPAPADGQTLTVTASITDADGNTSPVTTVSAVVDTTAPTAPDVSLGDGDNVITGPEISNGQVAVRVDLAGTGAVAGDTLTVNGTAIVLTAAQITAGVVTTNVTAPANGQTLNVSVTLTDAAGNSSVPVAVSAVVNSELPGSPGVTLGDGDEYLNAEETAGGNVVVTISLGGTGAVAGDTLTVNGTTITLTAAQIAAGEVETTLPAPADGQTLTVTASVTDGDGNSSPPTTVSAVVDTTPPTAPAVSLGDGDNVITGPEISNGQVGVRIDLAGTGAVAGDTLTVNGTAIVLTAAQIAAGVVTTNVTAPANGQTLNVSVTLTDAAGNDSTPTSVSALVDTDLPGSPVITIGDGDAFINASEITGGSVSISVNIANTGAVAGNTLTVNGTAIVLTAAQIAAGVVETTLTAPADGQSLFVSATVTDSAGDVSPIATASALVDTTPPSLPTVTLGDGDAFLGTDEIAGGVVEVSVNLVGTGAAAGDTLTVNGTTIVLTANDISAGVVTTTVTAPAEGQPLTVTTTLTDAAGNASPPSTVTAVVDTTPPGVPAITLGNGDNVILAGELVNGSVPVRIDLTGTNAVAGDTLTVNGVSVTLTAAQVSAGVVNTSVPALNDGAQLTVTASLTDAAGNASQAASASAVMNTELPGVPGITLGDGDPYINASEVIGGQVTVTFNLAGTGAVAGDTLTINGIQTTLTATEIANGVATRPVTAPPDGGTLTVTATITDGSGLTSPAITVSAPVDTSAPSIPTLTVGDGDGFINAGEISNGAVAVRVSLTGTDADEGDTLTINGTAIVLTAAQIAAGAVDTTVPAPANGQTLSVNASLTDIAGNSSPITTVSVVIDTTPPGQPVLTVGNGDGFINSGEITNGQVAVSVSLNNTGAAVGDTLTVNGVQTVLTQAMITAGVVTTSVAAVGDGQTLTVEASLTDPAGNSSTVSTVTAEVDLTPPDSPIVTLGDGDLFINASEIVNGAVSVNIDLTGTGADVGDTVTINGTAIILTAADIAAQALVTSIAVPPSGETLTVNVSITDPAGNSSPTETVTVEVDTDLFGMPSITIGNGDAFVIDDEVVGGNVSVTIDITGTGAVAGDWLVVNGQIVPLTQADIDANLVQRDILVPTDGSPLTVTATLNDTAGNVSPIATASATVDLDVPTAPTVVLGNGDGLINAAEAAGGVVTVTVSIFGTGAVAGDRLIVNGTTTVLTQPMITAGEVVTTVPAAANGQTLTVTAQLSDAAGNLSPVDTVSELTDTVAPTLPGLILGSGGEFITVGDVVNGEVTLRVNIAGTGAEEGDIVTVNGIPTELQASDILAGFINIGIQVPPSGEDLDVEVSLTDAAGNTSPIAEVSATVDTIAPTVPTVTLGSVDGWLGIADIVGGRATVLVSLTNTGAQEGDILTVNGQTIVLTAQMIDDDLVTTSVPALADGQTLTVEAFLTDPAGNTSDIGSDTAEIDLTAPGQPLVTVGNGDGFINAVEATGGVVAVEVSLAGTGADEGDTLIVGGVPIPLTAQMIIDGVVPTTVPVLGQGPLVFDVTIRDQAGNTSPPITITTTVDTEAPDQPGVTLGNGDATIIFTELENGEVPVTISLGADAAIGDTLTVNGTTIILDATHIANSEVNLTLPAPGNGQTFNVSATITDAAGNVSLAGSAAATINTGIPGAPTLTLGDGDDFITADEIVGGLVTVRIDLAGTGASPGDILTVNGVPTPLTPAQITAGFLTTTVLAPLEGQPLNVSASINSGGNISATVTATAVVDTIAPGEVGVSIGDGNGFIVAGEISNGSVAVTIDLAGADAAPGDTLTVNGTTIVLTAAQIAAGSVVTSVTVPANGQTLTINATLADPAGNTSDITTVIAVVDTTAPGLPVISIGNGDGFILPGEITGGNVSVSVSLAGTGAVAGDILTINGTPTTLTAQDITTGSVTASILAPADGGTLNVSASLTDAAGNSSPIASVSAVVDTTVPTAPAVTLGNGDAYINAAEVIGGRVNVSVNISGSGAAAGDRLIVNGTTIVLTGAQISAGTVTTTVAAPTSGQTLTVNATITDASGNISLPGTAVALVDTTIPTPPTLSIGNGDAFIGIGEISGGSVAISVSLAGTGAVAGDTLTVNGTSIVLSAAQVLAGTVATSLAAPANGGTLNVSASITDVAGNTSTIANASAVVDTVAPTIPGISLGANGDAYINASEVIGGSVAVSVSLAGTGAVAGDRLTINGTTVVLTAAQVAAGVYATSITAPATGATLTVNALLTDAAGNTSPLATASAAVDTTPPAAPTVSFLNDTGTIGDGISTDGTIRVTGIEPGARWEYSTNGGTSWTLGSGPGFTLSTGSYGNVLVRQTDLAGNTSTRTVGPVSIINLVANDDATTIPLTINQQIVNQPKQTGAVGGILNLGLLGNAVDVSVLSGQSPLRFTVADNTTQQVSVKGAGAALAALNLLGEQNYDLLVYRVEDGQTQAQLVHTQTDWLVFNPGVLGLLLPSWTGSTIALPQFEGGGTYYVVLANPGGLLNLSALANMTVETTSNVVTDYRPVSGSVAGNVLTGDITVAGTIVSSVDQTAVSPTGLVIHGDHGTLTIGRNGAYSYQPDPLYTGMDGDTDTFTYTITSPDGSTSTAVLTITIDYPHGPQAMMMTASIEDVGNDDLMTMAMSFDDDTLDPTFMHASMREGTDTADPSGVDGNDLGSDQPNFEDLLMDQGGQEIDLTGLADTPEPDVSTTHDAVSADLPSTVAPAETTEHVTIDPFPASVLPEDQLHHVSVI
ncbi:VCBS repeat-containing protein [Neorhizobium huautlense]|uniref:VCBS repeat-containing protein n=1 Tax=Neorhizobium huautlense TaxID=67774 RepID=A0ABT9PLC2_9HYPH|nr:Ig-like domain repeat protein [Neorhizobium huautlense]MDP9835273.1 VCBS repeat-containing protein [Neorhizobium huautlense]